MTTQLLGIVAGVALTVALARQARRSEPRGRARRLRPGRSVVPPRPRASIAARLARADIDVAPETALRWWALGIAAGAWFAILLAPPLLVPAVAAAVVAGPAALSTRAGHSDRRVRAALPEVLDHVVARVRAGGTIPESLHAVAARPGPLAPDLRRLSARLELGGSLDESLRAWSAERPVTAVRSAAGALTMVTTIGGSAATPLEGLAASLRNDDAAAGEARALSAQARVSTLVVGLAPLAYLAFSALTDPASARVLIDTGAGRVCLVLGLALEAGAALWMRALGASAVSALVVVVGCAWGLVAALPVFGWSHRRSVARRLPATPVPVRVRPTRSWGPVGRVVGGLRRRRRAMAAAARLDASLPAAADLLVVAVAAGGAPIAAVEAAAGWAPEPVAVPFGRVLVALELGAGLTDALAEMAAAEPLLAPMADVLIAGSELGTPAAQTLTRLADEARGRARRRAEARARVLPVKLLFPLVFLVLPAFGLLTVVPALISAMSHL